MPRLLFWFFISLLLCLSKAKVPALLVFGDSVLDAGTNLYLANSTGGSSNNPPFGGSYFGYPTGRYSDGRTIADFLAQKLGLPFAPPFLKPRATFKHGANFASAGSRLLGSSSGSGLGYVSMEAQVDQFAELVKLWKLELGEDEARAWVNSSVLLIAIGSNDIQDFLQNWFPQNPFTRQQFVDELMDRYRSLLLKLYGSGARKIVLLGLGPVGCFPIGRLLATRTRRSLGCLDSANEFAMAFNSGLRHLTYTMNQNSSDLRMVLAKPFELLLGVIATPHRFGFLQAELACCGAGPFRASNFCNIDSIVCGDPSRFVFWDAFHLTEAADLLLLNSFWSGGLPAIEPYNLFRLAS